MTHDDGKKHEMNSMDHSMVKGESSLFEYLKLAGILISITVGAVVLQKTQGEPGAVDFMRWFMGVFFLVFASFKFIGYKMFATMFAGYDVIAKRFKPYAYAYPFIELYLGLLYIFNIAPLATNIATLIVMGTGTIGVVQEIRKRSGIHCACLGNVIQLPLSTVSLVEDLGMALMAVAMIIMM